MRGLHVALLANIKRKSFANSQSNSISDTKFCRFVIIQVTILFSQSLVRTLLVRKHIAPSILVVSRDQFAQAILFAYYCQMTRPKPLNRSDQFSSWSTIKDRTVILKSQDLLSNNKSLLNLYHISIYSPQNLT